MRMAFDNTHKDDWVAWLIDYPDERGFRFEGGYITDNSSTFTWYDKVRSGTQDGCIVVDV